jgi:hypothetical protein
MAAFEALLDDLLADEQVWPETGAAIAVYWEGATTARL